MTKLPEPAFTPDYGLPPVNYYTSEQMLQFRRDVLEESALLIEDDLLPDPVHDYQKDYNDGVKSLANKVRKLKDET